MEGDNSVADLIKLCGYIKMDYFYPGKSSSYVTIITMTRSFACTEIDKSVECMGSTAWGVDRAPAKNGNSSTNYICSPQHQGVGYMHNICMNTYCTPLECVVHTILSS